MKFCFFTLGCKVNLFETQALAQLAAARGHELADRDADAVVLNTCSVTAASEQKNLRAIHRLRRENPRAVLAVCGCLAQANPERLEQTGEVDLICGVSNRAAVIAACEEAVRGGVGSRRLPPTERGGFEFLRAGVPRGRTRALLKLQDGCDNYCTYCIIPYLRGRARSLPPETARAEARRLAEVGVHEIMVTGIEIASYGKDFENGPGLAELLEQLLAENPGVRFRLGSLEPRIADQGFCERLRRFPNLMPHFHLSLQSGCDRVLERMHRRYTTGLFARNAGYLREAFPDCSLTTDLIVGFPGEDEDAFLQSLEFLRRCAFAGVHVFPYSIRKGTAAAEMENQVPAAEKQSRAARAKAVAAELSEQYRRGFLGRDVEVLLEHPVPGGLWSGHSRYSFPVYVPVQGRRNTFCRVRLTALERDGLLGEAL